MGNETRDFIDFILSQDVELGKAIADDLAAISATTDASAVTASADAISRKFTDKGYDAMTPEECKKLIEVWKKMTKELDGGGISPKY
jgi:hypothetical protein